MKLIGQYPSAINLNQLEQLVALVAKSVKLGEFSGSASFDASAITALQQAAQDFTKLATDSAGERVTEDSLNRPIDLLTARFAALKNEANGFQATAKALLSVIAKDAKLIDDLLAALHLEVWVSQQMILDDADQTKWSYGMGYGRVAAASDIAPTNPATLVLYTSRPDLITTLSVADGSIKTAIVPPLQVSSVKPKNLTWTFSPAIGHSSISSGLDWAELSLLQSMPLISFSQPPAISVVLPVGGSVSSFFAVTGNPPGGSIPIYVQVSLRPRRNSTFLSVADATLGSLATSMPVRPLDSVYIEAVIAAASGTNGTMKAQLSLYKSDGNPVTNADSSVMTLALPPVSPNVNGVLSSGVVIIPDIPQVALVKLSFVDVGTTMGSWSQASFRVHLPAHIAPAIPPDDVTVYIPSKTVYTPGIDFVVSESGQVTPLAIPDGTQLTVRFTELYPGYQCSVDGISWSPVVMLDPARPYPDDETAFLPLGIVGNNFSITDELGNPTGLYLTMLNRPVSDYLFVVSTPADSVNPGATATLRIDFERPSYMTSLALSPFTTFPCRLTSLETQGLTSNTRTAVFTRGSGAGPVLDRDLEIMFPRTLVKTIYLNLYQENYEINGYSINPPDHLRREALSLLQAALPASVRSPQKSVPANINGAQYDFGVQDILGSDQVFTPPAVLVAGPYRLTGCPEVLRFDVAYGGSPAFYLCYRGLDASENVIDENISGLALAPASCIVFPWASNADLTQIVAADIYLKIVFTTPVDNVQKFLIQTSRV